jgi:hypothetical protein
MIYHVFHYNAYDGVDYRGDYQLHELKAMLKGGKDDRGIGYEKIDIHESIIIKGEELSLEELDRIRES